MLREIFKVALRSVLANKLSCGLTVSIITIGITCLIGIQTSIEVLTTVVSGFYENIGVNSFTISADNPSPGKATKRRRINPPQLSYNQVRFFAENYNVPSYLCIFCNVANGLQIRHGTVSSDPNVEMTAIEGDYLEFSGHSIAEGRTFTQKECEGGENVCIIGSDIVSRLFHNDTAVGEIITANGRQFKVVGTLKSMGALFSGSCDNSVLIPAINAQRGLLGEDSSYEVGIAPLNNDLKTAIAEAGVLFRSCRRLTICDPADFKVDTTDWVAKQMSTIKGNLSVAALLIGLISILGAAIGLMNIMLVSVKERTREIGTIKTLGATQDNIKGQFLMEAVIIGQIGCILGILTGTATGNILSLILETEVELPWKWMAISIAICFAVSLFSGYLPARRAANLDPIEALRYE